VRQVGIELWFSRGIFLRLASGRCVGGCEALSKIRKFLKVELVGEVLTKRH
jgi:hypothetical protein